MYTGTFIEDLIATVERAEAKARDAEPMEVEPWLETTQEDMNCDSKFLGVA